MSPAEASAHIKRIQAEARARDEENARSSAAATKPPAPPPSETDEPLRRFDTGALIQHANALAETLDALDATDEPGLRDELLAQGLRQSGDALRVVSEQPIVIDPQKLQRELGITEYSVAREDGPSPNAARLTELRSDPAQLESFLDTETAAIVVAGATPATAGRIRWHIADTVVDGSGDPPGDATRQQVKEAEAVLAAETRKPSSPKCRNRLLLSAFEAIGGAVVGGVDALIIVPLPGIAAFSMMVGGVLIGDGINGIRAEKKPVAE